MIQEILDRDTLELLDSLEQDIRQAGHLQALDRLDNKEKLNEWADKQGRA